ncbi:MAG: 4Fe-4S dicluster domain-containing protein [Candidatus Omnitrophica bacterium]|nr:4Fe-4S dicluster domain-containing protein [Candidatus Omnitrophota bacterium]MCM8791164.1 4Fe-4S dicluster domain-containing protein [Candidatus Omnitrophota bacterium]
MKRLLIDLDICSKCDDCGMLCSYIQHPLNNGINTLREFAHFAINCRRCDDAPCVASCPWEAIELQKDTNMLKRYMMRCTSCKSCSRACPFGVIYPETIPFVIARCDFCLGRLREEESPICLESCAAGGIQYGEFEEKKEENIFSVSEHLLVKTSYRWERVPEISKRK